MPDGKPTLKERLEDHIVIVVATFAIGGFGAGWAARGAITPSGPSTQALTSSVDWQATAKEKGWIDKNLCPAMPLSLKLMSPGDGARIQYDGDRLKADVIVSTSRPIPDGGAVGIILNQEGTGNFYVSFPRFFGADGQTVFRETSPVRFPVPLDGQKRVSIWGFAIENKNLLGSVYGSLDQIKAVSPSMFMSDKVTINAAPEK